MIYVYFVGINFPAEFPGLAAKLPLKCRLIPAEQSVNLRVVITGDG